MSLTDNLIPSETVVLETQKHWIAPIRDSIWAALMIVGAFLLGWISPDSSGGLFGAIGRLLDLIRTALFLGGAGWIAYNVVVWRTAEFGVTNLRVLRYEGLIQRRTSETLLSAVSDVKLGVGLLGQQLGYGDLRIYTMSGESGADDFRSITRPTEFRNAMMAEKLKDQTAARGAAPAAAAAAPPPPAAPTPPTAPASDAADALVRLAALRDQGVISPEEFEAKKAEILTRI